MFNLIAKLTGTDVATELNLKTTIEGMMVSTVKLPMEHWGGMWYETCAFLPGDSDVIDRYKTEAEARAGHAKYVAMLEQWVAENHNGTMEELLAIE